MTAEVFLLALLTLRAVSMRTVQGQLTIAVEAGLSVYKNGTVVDWSCCDDAGDSKDLSVFVDGVEIQYREASSGMILNGMCFGGNITIFPSPNGNCFMELKCRSIESTTSKSLQVEFPPPRDPNYKYTSNEMIEFFWKPPDSIQSYNYSVCSDFSNLKQCSNTSELFECFKKSNMPLVVNVSVLFGNCVGAPATITIEPGNTKNMDSLVKGLSSAAGVGVGVGVVMTITCTCTCVCVYSHCHKKKKRRRRSLGESQLSDKSSPSPKEEYRLRPHAPGMDAPPPSSTTRPTCTSTGSPDVADETSSALPFSCNAEYNQNQKSLM